ncbi:hepatitis A virus cellular receptor 1 homolog isoform X1 [Dromiciops gliroides]|uniref:hepatitis A virus cellular receptor 1 homolog isoform X1 n=1 Tax=Dromiciops gliroides TaxID=33562 RepID=UPI001CC4002E|nr:hepatitis A virus cellular receptor 1 homolog isoform X1 [Dromiciops gliroides]
MGLPVLFIGLLTLLLAGPSESAKTVKGIVGQSVTLPCTYSVHAGVTTMCWGRGWCPLNKCLNEIIWTDGHKMTFQHSKRYHLKENISQGIVSLTIENLTEADAGAYCCRVEILGWFNDQKVTVILKVEQAITTTALTTLASTHPMLTTLTSSTSTLPMLMTTMNQSSDSSTPVWDIVTTSPSVTSEGKNWTQPDIPIGVNDTVIGTSEDYHCENKTAILQDQMVTTNYKVYIGVAIFVVLFLILILVFLLLKGYFYNRKNAQSLRLAYLVRSTNEGVRTSTEDSNRAEDNVYTMEETVYTVEGDNVCIIEEEDVYAVPTCNGKQQPSKI